MAPTKVMTMAQFVSVSPPFERIRTRLSVKFVYLLFTQMHEYVKEVFSFPMLPLLGISMPFSITFHSYISFVLPFSQTHFEASQNALSWSRVKNITLNILAQTNPLSMTSQLGQISSSQSEIWKKLPRISFQKSFYANLSEQIVRGRIRIRPILLYWFILTFDDSCKIYPIFAASICYFFVFIFRRSFMESAKTAEKLNGLLSNHSIYLEATKLRLQVPLPQISPQQRLSKIQVWSVPWPGPRLQVPPPFIIKALGINNQKFMAEQAMNEPTTSPIRNPKNAPYIVSSSSSFFYRHGKLGYLLAEFRILPMWWGNCINGFAAETLETEKNLFVLMATSCLIILLSVRLGKYRFFSSRIRISINVLTSLLIIYSDSTDMHLDY